MICLIGLGLLFLSTESVQAQVRPIIHSTGPMVNQRVVTRFTVTNYERIRKNQTNLSCVYMPECHPCEPGYETYGPDGAGYEEYVDETAIRGQCCSPCQSAYGPSCGLGFSSYLSCFSAGNFWFQNYGDFVTQQERNGLLGYHADSYGLNLGYDLLRSQQTVFGVAVGGNVSHARARRSHEKTETDSFLVALYGGTDCGIWNLLGSIGYVHAAIDSKRASLDDADQLLYGNHLGDTMFGSFEISNSTMQQSLGISPFLSYDFISMKENAWGESNRDADVDDPEDALSIRKRRSRSYLQTLGLRFERAYYEESGWLVQPSLSLGWLHDYGQRRITTVGFLDGAAYSYKGTVMNKNRFVMSLNVTASMGSRVTLFARYDGEYNNHYNAQTAQFGFGLGY